MFDQLALFRTPPPSEPAKHHHVQLGHRVVTYTLRRGARRRLSMTIDERGLRIGAPLQISIKDIEQFISGHAEWVLTKLDEFESAKPSRQLWIGDGVQIPLLGSYAEVRTLPGANRIRWLGNTLLLEARPGADLQALAQRGLQRRALAHFHERMLHYTQVMQHPAPALALSSARTRWGSCSSKTGIRLNWRLIHLAPELINYVVVHELAHLLEMNHSPRFWSEVERLYPDWKTARRELKTCSSLIPIL